MDEVIIFSVKIDQTEALKESAEMTKQIEALTQAQKDLAATGDKTSVAYAENAAALRALKKEQSDVNRSIDNSVKSFNSANGSINQQRANLSLLTQQYNKLSKEERDNADVGGKLQKQIKSLSDELKGNEGAIGDNRRSVGDYTGSILEASKSIKIMGFDLGSIKEGLKKAKEGVDIAKSGFSGFDGIIKASALGIAITLISGLIAVVTRFEPVMDKVNGAIQAVTAGFDIFVQRLIVAGNGTIKIITGYFEGLMNVWKGLYELASGDFSKGIDTLKGSFDGMIEGVNEVRGSFDGMGDAMASAGKEAYALSEALDALGDRQLAQITINAEAKKSVDQLLLQSKNRTLSEKERLKILADAGKVERANFEQNKKLAEDEYQIALKQARQKTQLSNAEVEELLTNTERREELEKRIGTLKGPELIKLAEMKAKTIELENETINVEEKIANRRDALIEAETAKREKAREAQKKIEGDYIKTIQANEKILLELETEVAARRLELSRKGIEQTQSDADKAVEIELNKMMALAQIAEAEAITIEEKSAAKTALLEAEYQQQLNALSERNATQEEYDALLIISNKKRFDVETELASARVSLEQSTASQLVNIANGLSQLADEQTVASKAFALVGTTIATYQAAQMAYLSAFLPAPTIASPIIGAISAGIAVATGLKNIQKITEAGNAAAGGGTFYTKGPTMLLVGDNAGGRERVTVEPIASRGKTTVSRGSGLVKMAGGGTLISDGGAAYNGVTEAVKSQINIKELLSSMPAPIVKVTDINKVNTSKSKVVKASQLS